jgi:hypothetical protein
MVHAGQELAVVIRVQVAAVSLLGPPVPVGRRPRPEGGLPALLAVEGVEINVADQILAEHDDFPFNPARTKRGPPETLLEGRVLSRPSVFPIIGNFSSRLFQSLESRAPISVAPHRGALQFR